MPRMDLLKELQPVKARVLELEAQLADPALFSDQKKLKAVNTEYAQVRRWRTRAPLDPAAGELTGNGRPRRAAILAATLVEPAE